MDNALQNSYIILELSHNVMLSHTINHLAPSLLWKTRPIQLVERAISLIYESNTRRIILRNVQFYDCVDTR